jgi:hypothetical protein
MAHPRVRAKYIHHFVRSGGVTRLALETQDGGINPPLLEITDALENGADDEWERDCRVFEDFSELAAFFGRYEFAPADGFGVRAAAEAAPVHWFGTDAHAVVIALEGKIFVAATGHEFGIDAKLLRPVARNATADGENAHFFGGHHGAGELLEIFKGIEAKTRTLFLFARILIEGEIQAEFGIRESRDEDGHFVFASGFENAAAFGVFAEKFADTLVELPAADNFIRLPLVEDTVDDLFDVIEIGFGLERIVHTIVAGKEKFVVVHFPGIVAKVRTASGFDKAVGHKCTGGNDGFDNARFNEIAKDQTHFADGESTGESHDDEAVLVASHGLQNVGSITDLARGVRGVAHGADKIIDRFDFGKVERIDGAEFVFDRIMKNATSNGFAGRFGHYHSSHKM